MVISEQLHVCSVLQCEQALTHQAASSSTNTGLCANCTVTDGGYITVIVVQSIFNTTQCPIIVALVWQQP